MPILIKSLIKHKILDTYRCLTAIQTRKGHWYPYYKPGPYPKTKEEREAAAKKYNLLPEEYELHPKDSIFQPGDYPKLPPIAVENKDPWHPWDHEELRRGFNEPVHTDIITLFPETAASFEEFIRNLKESAKFLTFVLIVCSVFFYLNSLEWVQPKMEKQYPTPGVTHYTFELDYDKKSSGEV